MVRRINHFPPSKVYPDELTPDRMAACVDRLQRRIDEVEALDPASVRLRFGRSSRGTPLAFPCPRFAQAAPHPPPAASRGR